MPRADGKFFQQAADEVSHDLLRQLLSSKEPLTQRALVSALPYDSSTISRRMGDLEDLGLVRRASGHAPYRLLFPKQTRELLRAGAELGRLIHDKQAADLAKDIEELDDGSAGGEAS